MIDETPTDEAEHEPPVDLMDAAESAFRTATAKHRDTQDNRDLIHADFDKEITSKVGSGEIQIVGKTVRKALTDYAWELVNQAAGRRTQSELARMFRGQLTLDAVDDVLDYVVVVGKKRRSTLRHLNAADVQRMLTERQANRDKQIAAYSEFEDIAAWLVKLLKKHKTLPAAITAGSVPLAPPATGTATA